MVSSGSVIATQEILASSCQFEIKIERIHSLDTGPIRFELCCRFTAPSGIGAAIIDVVTLDGQAIRISAPQIAYGIG